LKAIKIKLEISFGVKKSASHAVVTPVANSADDGVSVSAAKVAISILSEEK